MREEEKDGGGERGGEEAQRWPSTASFTAAIDGWELSSFIGGWGCAEC